MNIQKIAQWIQKNNKDAWNKAILAFISFLGFDFCMTLMSGSNGLTFLLSGQCIVAVAALEVGRYQWNRYLYVNDGEILFEAKNSLSEVIRMQAFPVEKYFAYVNKKMLISAVLLGICSVLLGILGATGEEGKTFAWGRFFIILCFSAINMLCPFLVGIWKKIFWIYQSKMGTKGKLNMAQLVCGKIFVVIEVVFMMCAVVLATIFLWAIISNIFAPNIDETVVVLRSYSYGYSFTLIIITVIAALWALVSDYHMKKISKAVGVIAGVLFIASVIVLVVETHIYTEVTDKQITVRQLWNTKTYEIEDVKRFKIFNEDDMIQMKIYFDDKNFAKVSGPSQTYSKMYEETYYSEYNFIADFIERLQEVGTSGQIEDVEKLQDDVVDLAPQVKRGLEKIMQLMK